MAATSPASAEERISCETHSYDGRLEGAKHEIRSDLKRVEALTDVERGSIFTALYAKLKTADPFDHVADYFFGLVTSEDPGNWDPVNRVHTHDLLCLCYDLSVRNPECDIIPVLAAQLAEISLGSCAQGRTTRILQAYMMCKDCQSESDS